MDLTLPRLFCVVLVALSLATPGAAVNVVENGDLRNDVISGTIAQGNLDRRATIKTDPRGWFKGGRNREPELGLDSPDGGLPESARTARFACEMGFHTRVDEGAICRSVCAIIFTVGHRRSDPTAVEGNRILHFGGDLVFQRPSIAIDATRKSETAQLRQAHDLGMQGILTLAELPNSRPAFDTGTMMHPSLFHEMFGNPPGEVHRITTIGQALCWDIGPEGVPEHPLTQPSLQRQRACENDLLRDFRRPSAIFAGRENNFMTKEVFRLAGLRTRAQCRLLPDHDVEELAQGRACSFRYRDMSLDDSLRTKSEGVAICGHDSHFNAESAIAGPTASCRCPIMHATIRSWNSRR